MIFGFSGKMGTGKNFIAEKIFIPLLKEYFPNTGIMQMAFADQLKINTMVKYDLSMEQMTNKTGRIRTLLQKEGTENGRDKLGKDIWISYLDKWIELYKDKNIEHFVITDVRFLNEIEYIKSKGGKIIRIHAHDRNIQRIIKEGNLNIQIHPSETELDNYINFDLLINNSNNAKINEIREKLTKIL